MRIINRDGITYHSPTRKQLAALRAKFEFVEVNYDDYKAMGLPVETLNNGAKIAELSNGLFVFFTFDESFSLGFTSREDLIRYFTIFYEVKHDEFSLNICFENDAQNFSAVAPQLADELSNILSVPSYRKGKKGILELEKAINKLFKGRKGDRVAFLYNRDGQFKRIVAYLGEAYKSEHAGWDWVCHKSSHLTYPYLSNPNGETFKSLDIVFDLDKYAFEYFIEDRQRMNFKKFVYGLFR